MGIVTNSEKNQLKQYFDASSEIFCITSLLLSKDSQHGFQVLREKVHISPSIFLFTSAKRTEDLMYNS